MPEKEEILLGQLAVKKGFISREELEEALRNQETLRIQGTPKQLGQILTDLGLLTEKQAQKLLSEQKERAGAIRRIGHFEVYAKLGEGGMGAVYLAKMMGPGVKGGEVRGFPENPQEGPLVALKILPPKLARDDSFLTRFRREVEVLSRLNHPNIVRAVDWGRADSLHFLAMDFIQGENSYQKVARDGPLEEREAITLALEMARALEYAHSKGIIHRDIKPENILIDLSGVMHLTDFGLVSRVGTQDEADITSTGTTVGTPYYISPEQAQGNPDVDIRSDLYSLGATLYHLLTGEVPFDGDSAPVIMTKYVVEPVPNPLKVKPRLSPSLAAIVMKLMAKGPRDRYQTPTELIDDLQRIWKGDPPLRARVQTAMAAEKAQHDGRRSSTAVRHSRAETRGRTAIREPVGVKMSIGISVLLLLAIAVFLYFSFMSEGIKPTDDGLPVTYAPLPKEVQNTPAPPKNIQPDSTMPKNSETGVKPAVQQQHDVSMDSQIQPKITPEPRDLKPVAYSIPFGGDTPVRGRFVPDPKGKKGIVCAPSYHNDEGRQAIRFIAMREKPPLVPVAFPENQLRISYLAKGLDTKIRVMIGHSLNGYLYFYPSTYADLNPDGEWRDLSFLLRNATCIPEAPMHDITIFTFPKNDRAELYISAVDVLDAPHAVPYLVLDAVDIGAPQGWRLENNLLWTSSREAFIEVDYSPPDGAKNVSLGLYARAMDAPGKLRVYSTASPQTSAQEINISASSQGGDIRSIPVSLSSTVRIEAVPGHGGLLGIARIVIYKNR